MRYIAFGFFLTGVISSSGSLFGSFVFRLAGMEIGEEFTILEYYNLSFGIALMVIGIGIEQFRKKVRG